MAAMQLGKGPRVVSEGAQRLQLLLPMTLVSEPNLKDASASSQSTSQSNLTVYTIRFTTGTSRGAAMSDPNAAVNVCLIGHNGTAALHRVSPVNDPLESRAHTIEMCQMIGPDVGADCSLVIGDASGPSPSADPQQQQQQQQRPSSAGPLSQQQGAFGGKGAYSGGGLTGRPPPPPPPKRRFQEGVVDEVSILVPELGPLAGVLVGVESGTWYLDEMDVSSSRTHHLDRFVCRRMLGGVAGEGAAMLTPVPVGAVVYGEGESAVVLSKEQASALWSINMSDYADLKRRLAATTTLLVASGASLAALTGGTAAALPYTAGGVVGLVYQWMLMRGVDHVMEAASGQRARSHPGGDGDGTGEGSDGEGDAVPFVEGGDGDDEELGGRGGGGGVTSSATASRVLASTPVRLGFVCASAALGLALLSQEEAATEVATGALPAAAASAGASGSGAAWQLALGALGFLTYKVALVGVSLGDQGAGAAARLGAGASVLQKSSSSTTSSSGGGSNSQVEKFKRD
ncbi:hypothetical protein GPECTOR_116g355 [Gonium pectorale]|uniref:DUF7755 domain-containing protein n=1 Tax=Gonium pectorale TaxID=33097 RepID=A0A150FYY4_GONPE|nr:hypothetical protein GPECTOR_116g355 [Gonium pectorale]|eukprot:KXZ42823.1 hypothetical protein GPECTOR_116g355 [Gonium pectorale]